LPSGAPAELEATVPARAAQDRPDGGTVPAQPLAAAAERGPDAPWATTFGAIGLAASPTVIAARGEELYLGGTFDGEMAGLPAATFLRVAHWDGSSWNRLGDGVDAPVHAIAVVGDDVYVGGEFTTVAGGTVDAHGLARWDGTSWSPVAGGVSSSQSWSLAAVRALASDGRKLYVAGAFDVVGAGDGAIAAAGLAALDLAAGAWETYDGGTVVPRRAPARAGALALAGDRLYVGGTFTVAGGAPSANLALWRGTASRAP
jgi:hypothetical protein